MDLGFYFSLMSLLAVRTGLEPATSCVTGRHSNQLNYRTFRLMRRKDNCVVHLSKG
jgi:hypothetical protein